MRPVIAGPSIRAQLKDVELSATALDSSGASTSSETDVWVRRVNQSATRPVAGRKSGCGAN
jgi:hypothetical protein